jgi:O-antigen/teichoic acid export membrane protein
VLSDGRTDINLRARLLSGTFWVGTSQFVVQGTQFIGLLILVRLLSPEDFGLIGMCLVFIGIGAIFVEMGLPNAMIQARELTRSQITSAAWVCLAISLIMAAGVVSLASVISYWFKEPSVVPLLRVLPLIFIINSAGVVPDAFLRREMRFREIGIADIARSVGFSAATVPLALSGFGVWSLAIGEISASTVRLVLLVWFSKGLSFGRLDLRSLKPLISFGLKNTGSSVCHGIRQQIDSLIVGRFLSAGLLGGYSIIIRTVTAPQRRISWIIMKVTFPGFSSIQDNDERLRAVYLKVVSNTAFITLPVLAYVAANTGPFVNVLFGGKWGFIVPSLRLFCLTGAFISVITLSGPVILAKGRAGFDFMLSLTGLISMTLLMLVSVGYGLIGVSFGFLIYVVLIGVTGQIFANKIIGLRQLRFLYAVLPGICTSLIVGFSVYLTGNIVKTLYGDLASVPATAFVALLNYAFLAWILRRDEIKTISSYLNFNLPSIPSVMHLKKIHRIRSTQTEV